MERPEIYAMLRLANGEQSASHRIEIVTNFLLEQLFELQVAEMQQPQEVGHGNR